MTTASANPFVGKAKHDTGDYKTDIPSEDTHEARIVALIDLGTHLESFDNSTPKATRKCLLVYELDEEMSGMKGVNHVVGVRYTVSHHEKATLNKIASSILNDGQKFTDQEIDYTALVGQACTVQISHKQVASEKGPRTYVNVGTISAVSKKHRDKVFSPKRPLVVWWIGMPKEKLPDYLPRIYGEEVADIIGRCQEIAGKPVAAPARQEPDAEPDTGPIPF